MYPYRWIRRFNSLRYEVVSERNGVYHDDNGQIVEPASIELCMEYIKVPIMTPTTAPARSVVIVTTDSLSSKDEGESLPVSVKGNPYLPPRRISIDDSCPNDCGVVALAHLFGMQYSSARVKAMHLGWSTRHGIQPGALDFALEQADLELCGVPKLIGSCAGENHWPKGRTFVLYTIDHVMVVIDGELLNAGNTLYEKIQSAYEVLVPLKEVVHEY